MDRQYCLYVNGVLAKRFLTLNAAIKEALKHFPSYIKKNNAVVWTGVR